MVSGTVIFLNGTSSSGKSSIAEALQQALTEPYLHVALDVFFGMLPTRFAVGEDPWTITEPVKRMMAGFHGSIAALVEADNNIIVDHVLQEPAWVRDCADRLAPFRAILVGVQCPLEELERREAARGNRSVGLAKFQNARVHAHQFYDLEVDTSVHDPLECARRIAAYLQGEQVPTAFRRLRDSYRALS